VCVLFSDFFYDQSDVFPDFRATKIAGTNIYKYTAGEGDRLCILQADIFSEQLSKTICGLSEDEHSGIDCVWDRAALFAVNPSTREAYVKNINRLLKSGSGSQWLLQSFEYDGQTAEGPPFELKEEHVKELFPAEQGYVITQLDEFPSSQPQGKGVPALPTIIRNRLIHRN
jgi:hypothetical protein